MRLNFAWRETQLDTQYEGIDFIHCKTTTMLALLALIVLVAQSTADISGTDPATGSCICADGTAVNVRDSGKFKRNLDIINLYRLDVLISRPTLY